jgi:fermentation-respiration switch protein FrsA (DUF1100 family)
MKELGMSTTSAAPAAARKRRPWWRWLVRLAVAVVFAYLGILGALMAIEDRLVYHPIPAAEEWRAAPNEHVQDVELRAADGTRLHGWWYPQEGARGAVLFCHGNHGNVSQYGKKLPELAQALGESVLIFDYPGFGRSEGQPTEAGCYAAADAAYDWLTGDQQVPAENVVLCGESLGGGVAVDLASRRPHRTLVLVKTFTSLPDVGQNLLPCFPVHWVMHNRFDSLAKIGRCERPVFVAHGTDDNLVPYALGQRLFAAANEPKAFFPVEGAGHNDWLEGAFLPELQNFLAAHAP